MKQPPPNPMATPEVKRPEAATSAAEFQSLLEAELLARERQRETPQDRQGSLWTRFADRVSRVFATA